MKRTPIPAVTALFACLLGAGCRQSVEKVSSEPERAASPTVVETSVGRTEVEFRKDGAVVGDLEKLPDDGPVWLHIGRSMTLRSKHLLAELTKLPEGRPVTFRNQPESGRHLTVLHGLPEDPHPMVLIWVRRGYWLVQRHSRFSWSSNHVPGSARQAEIYNAIMRCRSLAGRREAAQLVVIVDDTAPLRKVFEALDAGARELPDQRLDTNDPEAWNKAVTRTSGRRSVQLFERVYLAPTSAAVGLPAYPRRKIPPAGMSIEKIRARSP